MLQNFGTHMIMINVTDTRKRYSFPAKVSSLIYTEDWVYSFQKIIGIAADQLMRSRK